ncbi:cytochrome P450 [Streptomyces telluris]|uniref:Cytochrome P450 n=1 Tax=Streptomyces telluris TaxID=2720021 RepID=A0A9X2RMG6_9ACTN|nr:cytochrome P450 [Streptomyces telluris]MCQ8771912.1 cytochrome P450 [Streptomyces telluris]NJP80118.1 cytochrome P450 [Streptomyces telluris]
MTVPGPTRAGWADSVRLLVIGVLPAFAQGFVLRRPLALRVTAALDTHAWGCRVLDDLRERHGPGPVLVTVFGRTGLVLLSAEDARRVLAETGTSFTSANREKTAALSHFEPDAVLITPGPLKAGRRRFNEAALDGCTADPGFREACRAAVEEEIRPLLAGDTLTWGRFHAAHQRIVRRIVFGDAARDDERITELRDMLRSDGNWAMLHRKRHRLRAELFARTQRYLDLPEPGGLARGVCATPATAETRPVAQMQHWFFAFDAAPISDYLTLGLLACRPEPSARARADRAYLRACVLDAQRLWPTTMVILRDSTTETHWPGGWTVPAGTAVIFCNPFFQRDARRLPYADRFEPEVWLDGRAEADWSIAPFSRGPARCPGKEVVLSTSATLLTGLLARDWRLTSPHRLGPGRPLPRTADHTSLRFAAGDHAVHG